MKDIRNIRKSIIMSFLIVISMIIGLNNVSASIKTTFGEFPDLNSGGSNYDNSSYYMIMQHKSSVIPDVMYVGSIVNNCTYTNFYNSDYPNRTRIGFNSVGSGCNVRVYQYNGDNWVYTGTQINSGYLSGYSVYSYPYSDFNIATTIDFKSGSYGNGSVLNSAGDGFIYMQPTIESGLALDSQNRTIRYVRIYYDDYYANKENYVFQYHLSDEASDYWHYKYAKDLQYDESTGHYYYEFKIYMSTNIVARVLDRQQDIIGVEEIVGSVSDIYSVTDLSYLDGYTKYEIPVGYDTVYISGISGLGYIYVYEHADYVYSLYEYAPNSNKFYSYLQDTYEYDGLLHKWQYSLDTAMQMNEESNMIVYFNRDYTDDIMSIYVPNGAYVSFSKYEKQSDYIFTDDFSYKDENGNVQNGSRTLYLEPEDIINNFSIHSGIQILDASLTSIIKPMYAKFPIIAQLLELKDIYSYNEDLQTPPEFRVKLDFRPFGFNLNIDEKVVDFRFYEDNRETIFFFIKVGVTIITILKLISYFDNSKVGVV